ncbi:pentatricopeptide repeat-containing protein At3g49740 [Impatiens glandulifera]|uniref:pentatricopeptide repeat-containing protein At3g49740 n=1 Tax=Impatiens glandulifera TaxID=253017 RepID=UPI001FB0E43D|nr:pentatricopeptide repeat-containing protein At3g49740 [Impatiens glandulifera]
MCLVGELNTEETLQSLCRRLRACSSSSQWLNWQRQQHRHLGFGIGTNGRSSRRRDDGLFEIIGNHGHDLYRLNSLLFELTRSNQFSLACKLFCHVHSSHHLRPDHYTLSTSLTASSKLHDTASTGIQLHAYSIKAGFKAYPHVANSLLSMYSKSEKLASVRMVFEEIKDPDVYSWTTLLSALTKFGQVEYACKLLDEMPQRRTAVWNSVITGCAKYGWKQIALDLFHKMHLIGICHDNYTFASILSLCSLETVGFGKQVHSLVIRTGFLDIPSVVNALLTMYFTSELVEDAFTVFHEVDFTIHDQITYNAMIAGLASMEREEEALKMFCQMQEMNLSPTEVTFVSIMSSCSDMETGHQIHSKSIISGLELSTSVANSAITMYSKWGDLDTAIAIFERLEGKDLVSWNAMIKIYAQMNSGRAVISTYLQMQNMGIRPDEFTFGSLLTSSESVPFIEKIQAIVIKNGLISIIEVSNALMSAFSRHNNINQAYGIFLISCRNLISWNIIINGFQLNGFPVLGINQFYVMLLSGLRPNVNTLSIILSICASISCSRQGKQVHAYILKHRFNSEASLSNALISMYAKGGVLDMSLKVFDSMTKRDVISWNSIIAAYAQHGEGLKAVNCFQLMQELDKVLPDSATFTSVLSACSHSGLVDDGIRIFNCMVNEFGHEPSIDQFSSVVDLLGRAGYLDQIENIINSGYIKVDPRTWWAIFSSCAIYGNIRLGRIAAGFLLKAESNDDSAIYVQLSNIYASAGLWEEAAYMRELMNTNMGLKQPGWSWIQ